MKKAELERMKQFAGLTLTESDTSHSTKNMYQILDSISEADKPDFGDIDDDGDKEETAKKAAKDKEDAEVTEAAGDFSGYADNMKKQAEKRKKDKEAEEVTEADEELEESDADEKARQRALDKADDEARDKKVTLKKAPWEESHKSEQEMMREWSNSVYQNYDDRGTVMPQPEGETVDLSLRRYLNADPTKVQVQESWSPAKMVAEYKKHKGQK